MMITGNKGEWSEIYTLLKLLGEGKVYAGNEDIERVKDLFYPIVMILRNEKNEHYNYRLEDKDVVIQTSSGEVLLRLPASTFLSEAEALLVAIKEGTGAFSVNRTELFMKQIYCYTLKAPSKDKTDIHIVLHDRRTKLNSEMGFSIKSQLGGDSSLLNAGRTTNFVYKIEGATLNKNEINEINSIDSKNKILDRVNKIKEKGGKLVFEKVDNPIFPKQSFDARR